jgi:deoxyribonuclease IV
MLIGAHISAAGGLYLAPERAAAAGLECFQFFSRPPQGGPVPPLTNDVVSRFLTACDLHGFREYYVHAPYVINLASPDERIRRNSVEILRQELMRSSELGAAAMMTHIGSAAGVTRGSALETAGKGLARVMSGHTGPTRLLIELAAGAGRIIGCDFEEIRALIDLAGDDRIGVCLDTAHAFASGYELREADGLNETLSRFDSVIGLKKLVVIHANDSVFGLGEKKDRHEHIGRGRIGLEGFRAMLAHPALRRIDLIAETPNDEAGRLADVRTLKRLRGRKTP